MNKKLGEFFELGLDLGLFWQLEITEYKINMRASYSKRIENYVISKGFEQYDWIYADNPKEFEYKKGNCRILLSKK
jgi:hypothetical protein